MYDLDKESFGKFLAALRKDKGLTQRQLADRLFVSDKAVSKWERGLSIPDPALWIPLAELLGVTVTELLLGRRWDQSLSAGTVDRVVKTAITCRNPPRACQAGGWRRALWFGLALAAGLAGLYACRRWGGWTDSLGISVLLAAGFGGYFWLLAPVRLPDVYDRYPTGFFRDGVIRMNLPGLTLTSQTWPAMVRAVRVWGCVMVSGLPLFHLAAALLAPGWMGWLDAADLVLVLGGLFLPLYAAGLRR